MITGEIEEEVCSTIEAASLLGIGVRTVQLWMDNGALKGWKTPGGHRRVTLSSINEILRQRGNPEVMSPRSGLLKVLVVEDSHHLLNLYRITLSKWNLPLEIFTAVDGFEGLIKLGEIKPDLLITDLKMPGMNGFDMIRKLKSEPTYADLCIVVVTALTESEINEQGGLPDQVTVFSKPIPFPRLEQLVRNLLKQKHQTP